MIIQRLLQLTPLLILVTSSFSQGLISHDFDDGDMGPFVDCTTQNPNFAKVVNNRLRTYWEQTSFNSSNRMTKGAEACGDPVHNGIGYLTWKNCWMGFTINIDNDYMGPNYEGIGSLAQIFGFNDAQSQFSWTALLEIEDGDLMWIDRRGIGSSRAEVVIYEDFPRGKDMDIIVHAVLSGNSAGLVEVYVNEELRYSAYNISIGMGEFDANDVQTNQSYTEFKIGQYNHSDATPNEIRIVDYDNLSWYDGVDGYDIVNPNKDRSSCTKTISLTEAECYDDSLGIEVVNNTAVGYIQNGDWASYNELDFTDMNSIEVIYSSGTVGGALELRLDSVNGPIIGDIDLGNSGGWSIWDTAWTNIDRVDGTHDIYLVFTGGTEYLFDLDKFGFSQAVYCNNSTQHLEAECYDNMLGILTENCSEGTANVGWIQNGDWVMHSGIDLTNMLSVKARVASDFTGGNIEVRLGSETGTLIGEIPVGNTSGNQEWMTDSINIIPTSGEQDVYFVFTGGDGYLFNVNWLEFSPESNTVTNINDHQETNLYIYPNPTTGLVHLPDGSNYEILDMFGNIIQTGTSDRVDLSNEPKGVYFVNIKKGIQPLQFKLIKR